jgi:hypothetical protein
MSVWRRSFSFRARPFDVELEILRHKVLGNETAFRLRSAQVAVHGAFYFFPCPGHFGCPPPPRFLKVNLPCFLGLLKYFSIFGASFGIISMSVYLATRASCVPLALRGFVVGRSAIKAGYALSSTRAVSGRVSELPTFPTPRDNYFFPYPADDQAHLNFSLLHEFLRRSYGYLDHSNLVSVLGWSHHRLFYLPLDTFFGRDCFYHLLWGDKSVHS